MIGWVWNGCLIDDLLIHFWLVDSFMIGWLIDDWLIDDFQVEIDKAGVLRQFVEHGIEYVAELKIIVGHEEGKTNTQEISKASVMLNIILLLYLYITYNV